LDTFSLKAATLRNRVRFDECFPSFFRYYKPQAVYRHTTLQAGVADKVQHLYKYNKDPSDLEEILRDSI